MPRPLRQGDVWQTQFDEGWERPAVIVSRAELNRGSTVLVVPCTSSLVTQRSRLPNHVFLPAGVGGLSKDSVAQTHLTQAVDTSLLMVRLGSLSHEPLSQILHSIAWVIDLFDTAEITRP